MCLLALVCGAIAFVVSFHVTDGRWVIKTLGVLFIVCGLGMVIRPVTVVDSDARIVSRHSRLFGRFPFWSRRYPFSDFCAVVILHVRRPNFGGDSDQYFVSLRRRSGRQVLISYFGADDARNCRPAEELGQRLSADLQIEIDEKDG
jgi:hypothetical protein